MNFKTNIQGFVSDERWAVLCKYDEERSYIAGTCSKKFLKTAIEEASKEIEERGGVVVTSITGYESFDKAEKYTRKSLLSGRID